MARKRETFTKLTPAQATAEVTAAITAAGISPGASISSSPQEVGRQRKSYLVTVVATKVPGGAEAALAAMRGLPGVSYCGTMGNTTAYISRRLV